MLPSISCCCLRQSMHLVSPRMKNAARPTFGDSVFMLYGQDVRSCMEVAVCISGRGRSYDVEPGDMTSSLLETPLLLKPQAKAMKQARGTNKGFESALYGNEADGEPRLAMHRT